jgi:hypothetical protein
VMVQVTGEIILDDPMRGTVDYVYSAIASGFRVKPFQVLDWEIRVTRATVLFYCFGFSYVEVRKLTGQSPAWSHTDYTQPEHRADQICEAWLWLMSLGTARSRMMAAKKTSFVRGHWSEERLLEVGESLGVSAHEVLTFMAIEPSNRAKRRASRFVSR